MDTDSTTKKKVAIYVRLLEEGTEVSRPTQAVDLGNGLFRIEATVDYEPEGEVWEFIPGSEVRVELRSSEAGHYLIAVSPEQSSAQPRKSEPDLAS